MTDIIQLRDVITSDLPIFFAHQRDPQATRMAAFLSRDQAAFTAHWARIKADASVMLKTILYNGTVAGNIVSFEMDGEREVGYWIGREFWGRGIATHALMLFLEQVTTRPLYAHIAKHNLGSFRVLEKCGFKMIGEDKGMIDENGELVEELILRLDN